MEELINVWLSEASEIVQEYFTYAGITFLIFYLLLRKVLQHRKIQEKMPKLKDYARDIFYSLITITIFATVVVLVYTVWFPYTNLYKDIDQYGWVYYVFTWIYMIFIHDTYFYWMHRMMHQKFLFKYVHKVHHLSTNPSPWTAYAFHPLEAVLEVMIVPILAFTIPIHREAVSMFFIFQIVYNIYGHLGFELYPKHFNKTKIGKWVNTSVAHNLHHKKFHGNYGLYTLFWDRTMKTLRKDYDDSYDTVTSTSSGR